MVERLGYMNLEAMTRFLYFMVFQGMISGLLGQTLIQGRDIDMMDRMDLNLRYLVKDPSLNQYFRISSEGVAMYASREDKLHDDPEFFLYYNEITAFVGMMRLLPRERMKVLYMSKGRKAWTEKLTERYKPFTINSSNTDARYPLTGVRIAVDPGHVAGSMSEAELEGKYIKVKATANIEGTAFWEANLTLATAHLIAEKLTSMGAEVLLTRSRPGQSAMEMSYLTWRRHHFQKDIDRELVAGRINQQKAYFWRNQATEKDIYRRFFTPLDLRARANKINTFRPHLTLIVHYNVDKENWEKRDREGYFKPGYDNYCMAFIPGGILKGELSTPYRRMHFLYLLVSTNIEESMRLSHSFIKASIKHTDVPVVEYQHWPDYLYDYCLPTEADGVFARNLALNGLVTSPLCYGESLCQDFWRELMWLSEPEFEIEGVIAPARVKAVADAYVEAVVNYVQR